MDFDLVIRNGTVVDGTGAEAFVGDVAISDGWANYLTDSTEKTKSGSGAADNF